MLRNKFEYPHLLIDMLLAVASLYGAYLLRVALPYGRPATPDILAVPPVLYPLVVAVWQLIFYQNDVYLRRGGVMFRVRLLTLAKAHLIASLLYFGVLYLTLRDVSRLQSLYFVGLFFTLMVVYRVVWRSVEVWALRRGRDHLRVIIVGTDENAVRLRDRLMANPRYNVALVGFFRLNPGDSVHPALEVSVVGDSGSLVGYVDQYPVDEVIISTQRYSDTLAAEISALMYALQPFPVNIRLAPDYTDISFFHTVTEDFHGLPLIGLRTPVFTPSQRFFKRCLDLLIAVPLVVVGLPAFLAVVIAIRRDSPGPVIIRQQRVGIHGRPFGMYKFRSMYADHDQNRFDETKLNVMKRPDDPRVTRVGRFLRRTSLDELPQLLNVIKGEMSLVGPRPELPARVGEYQWWQFKRFEVPQGMTGWWQVNGRANRPMHLHTEDDLYYIENYSLWLDLRILWRTARVVLTGEGAF